MIEPAEPEPVPEPKEVTLAFVGDILLGDGLTGIINSQGADYPWRAAAPLLRKADLAVGNLETSVSLRGSPAPHKQYTFRSHPSTLKGASRAGIDILSLANNHTLDWGPEALVDTIDHVRSASIHPVGAGKNAAEAFRPVLVTVHGIRIAFLAFTRVIPEPLWAAGPNHPGLAAGYDPKPVLAAVEAARPLADVIVVLFHWGEEVTDLPRQTDQELTRAMMEKGATIVIGHHPHVLQAIALHDSKLVAYSLGNFIFTSVERELNQETGVLTVTVGPSGVRGASFAPMYIAAGQPRLPSPAVRRRILTRLDRLSRAFGTAVSPDGEVGPTWRRQPHAN